MAARIARRSKIRTEIAAKDKDLLRDLIDQSLLDAAREG